MQHLKLLSRRRDNPRDSISDATSTSRSAGRAIRSDKEATALRKRYNQVGEDVLGGDLDDAGQRFLVGLKAGGDCRATYGAA